MHHVVFIENTFQTERHFTRGFRLGALRSGWMPHVVWLRDAANQVRPAADLAADIEAFSPDLMIWVMDDVLHAAEALEKPSLRGIPKASLWFDDFHRTYAIHQFTARHQNLCRTANLKTMVWDGFWRKEFQRCFSVPAHPIHLAADEGEYFPSVPTHFKGFEEALVFIGNIPSLNYIQKQAELLPMECRKVIVHTQSLLESSAYGRLAYDALEEAYQALPAKGRMIVDHFRSDISKSILLNHLAWLLAKREVRLRILRLAAKQRRLVILSGHSDKTFAQADELSRDMGSSDQAVQLIDTNHVGFSQLGCLYHIGGLHLQATDPQSIEGGIPFRVFETAASGCALLSDFKKELGECFEPEREILCFQNDQDFPDRLNAAIGRWEDLKMIGEAARQRFLKEHTWGNRFRSILSLFEFREENVPSGNRSQ